MCKIKMMFLGVFFVIVGVSWMVIVVGIDQYVLKEFIVDFIQFYIGDIVLVMYFILEYNIKQWQQCNLFVLDVGSYWIYMGGNYVLIIDIEGKIFKVYDGEIFYYC